MKNWKKITAYILSFTLVLSIVSTILPNIISFAASDFIIENFDTTENVTSTSGSIKLVDDGDVSALRVYNMADTSEVNFTKYWNNPIDLSSVADGSKKISFRVKLNDTSTVPSAGEIVNKGIRIDLISASGFTSGSRNWACSKSWTYPASCLSSNQWDTITLKASDTNIFYDWGGLDFSHIQGIMISMNVASGARVNFEIDKISVIDSSVLDDGIIESFSNNDGISSTSGTNSIITDENNTVLKVYNQEDISEINFTKYLNEPINLSQVSTGEKRLVFRVKLDDTSAVIPSTGSPSTQGIRIDLIGKDGFTSGNRNWSCATGWTYSSSILKNGQWGEITLTRTDKNLFYDWGGLNFSEIQGFFISMNLSPSTRAVFYIDSISLEENIVKDEDADALEPFTSSDGITSNSGSVIIDKDYDDTYLKMYNNENTNEINFTKYYNEPIDLTKVGQGKQELVFRVKVNDKSLLVPSTVAPVTQGIRIDLIGKDGFTDGTRNWTTTVGWTYSANVLKNNEWGEIKLTGTDTNIYHDWGGLNFSEVQGFFISLNLSNSAKVNFYVDSIIVRDIRIEGSIDDTFEKVDDWKNLIGDLNTDVVSPKEGNASMKLSGSADSVLAFEKILTNSANVSGIANANDKSLTIWVRVQDISKITKIDIDLISENGVDVNGNTIWTSGREHVRRWQFSAGLFKNNEWVQLQLTEADQNIFNPWNCSVDYSRIKKIAVTAILSGSGTYAEISFDNMLYGDYISPQEEQKDPDVVDGMNAKTMSSWVPYGTLEWDKEGSDQDGSIKLYNTGVMNTEINMIRRFNPTIDLTDVKNNQKNLSFKIKIADATKIKCVYLDLASDVLSNTEPNWAKIYRWEFDSAKLIDDEWVLLTLSKSTASLIQDDSIDWSKITYMGFKFLLVDPTKDCATVWIDDIRIIDPVQNEASPVVPSRIDSMNDNYDERWTSSGVIENDEENQTQGSGCLSFNLGENTNIISSRLFTPRLDLRGIKDSAMGISLWVKTDNISNINNISLRFGDNGTEFDKSIKWSIFPTELKDGEWSQVYLYYDDIEVIQGKFIWNRINSLIISIDAKSETSVEIDDISLYDPNASDPDGSPLINGPVILNDFDDGHFLPQGGFTVETNNTHSGNGALCLSTIVPAGGYVATTCEAFIRPRVNLGNLMMYGGTIEFWMYVSDPSRLEIGDNGEPELRIQIGGDEGRKNYLNCRWYDYTFDKSTFKANTWTKFSVDFSKPSGDTMNLNTYVESEDGREYNLYSLGYLYFIFSLNDGGKKDESGKRITADKVTVLMDDLVAVPNEHDSSFNEENLDIDNSDDFIPVTLDKNIVSFLTYKAIVASGITVDKLLQNTSLNNSYYASVVNCDGKKVEMTDMVATGMWLQIYNYDSDIAVATYYIEVGDPTNLTSVVDVEMPGMPDSNSGSLDDYYLPKTGISSKDYKSLPQIEVIIIMCFLVSILVLRNYKKHRV